MNLSESLESRLNDADRWLEESGLTLTTALADDVMIRAMPNDYASCGATCWIIAVPTPSRLES